MEKDRGTRLIAVLALVVGVVGLSIGFAAFTSNLKIENTSATITPDDNDFKVLFTDDLNKNLLDADGQGGTIDVTTSKILTSKLPATDASKITVPDDGEIKIDNTDHGAPKISGLSAGFTAPGQSVTYTFYTKNVGEYAAYLKNITADKVGSDYVKCTAVANIGNTNETSNISETSQGLIDNACKKISATVTVKSGTTSLGSVTLSQDSTKLVAASTVSDNNKLEYTPTQEYHTVVVEIKYNEGAEKVDEEFVANFGDITLTYGSTK